MDMSCITSRNGRTALSNHSTTTELKHYKPNRGGIFGTVDEICFGAQTSHSLDRRVWRYCFMVCGCFLLSNQVFIVGSGISSFHETILSDRMLNMENINMLPLIDTGVIQEAWAWCYYMSWLHKYIYWYEITVQASVTCLLISFIEIL